MGRCFMPWYLYPMASYWIVGDGSSVFTSSTVTLTVADLVKFWLVGKESVVAAEAIVGMDVVEDMEVVGKIKAISPWDCCCL